MIARAWAASAASRTESGVAPARTRWVAASHRPFALHDICGFEVPQSLQAGHVEITPCHFGQQVRALLFFLKREQLAAGLCDGAARLALAAALDHGRQAESGLSGIEG